MRSLKLILLASHLVLLASCDFYDYRLKIRNNSSEDIFVAIIEDTILGLSENENFMLPDYQIMIDSVVSILEPGSTRAWEFLAERSIGNKLHIFILSQDTLEKYDPHVIEEKQLFLKRIDISVKELEASNWTVTFSK